jgi:hypothetical protein
LYSFLSGGQEYGKLLTTVSIALTVRIAEAADRCCSLLQQLLLLLHSWRQTHKRQRLKLLPKARTRMFVRFATDKNTWGSLPLPDTCISMSPKAGLVQQQQEHQQQEQCLLAS